MQFTPSSIILRERLPNNKGEATGWVIILAGQLREREVLAVIAQETGLECARSFAQIVANKFKVNVKEEIQTNNEVATNQEVDFTYYPRT